QSVLRPSISQPQSVLRRSLSEPQSVLRCSISQPQSVLRRSISEPQSVLRPSMSFGLAAYTGQGLIITQDAAGVQYWGRKRTQQASGSFSAALITHTHARTHARTHTRTQANSGFAERWG